VRRREITRSKTLSVALQLDWLRDGGLDVGFVRPPVSDRMLNSEVLIGEALVIALPLKHRLPPSRASRSPAS
jgi:DNA-binding transcriptional LysR family regulator